MLKLYPVSLDESFCYMNKYNVKRLIYIMNCMLCVIFWRELKVLQPPRQ